MKLQKAGHRKHICRKSIGCVFRWRSGAGRTEATAGDPINVTGFCEPWRKVIENMGGVTKTGEQHDIASGTAPVEHFQTHIRCNRNS